MTTTTTVSFRTLLVSDLWLIARSRRWMVLLVAILVASGVVRLSGVVFNVDDGGRTVPLPILLKLMVPWFAIVAGWASAVWLGDRPRLRDRMFAVPASHDARCTARLAAGAVYLAGGLAFLFAANIAIGGIITVRALGGWWLADYLTSTALLYTIVGTIGVLSSRPALLFAGVVVGSMAVGAALEHSAVAGAAPLFGTGPLGLGNALGAAFDMPFVDGRFRAVSAQRAWLAWLGAWLAVAIGALRLATRRIT